MSEKDESSTPEPEDVIQLQNEFYRDSYYAIIRALLLSFVVLAVMVLLLLWNITHPPPPLYFPVSDLGQITQGKNLQDPLLNDDELSQWAADAVRGIYAYNFVNYRNELQAASQFFTPTGWQDFLNALKASQNIEAITAEKLVVSIDIQGAPAIVNNGVDNQKRYFWQVNVPVKVNYENANQIQTVYLTINLTIVRVGAKYSARGVAIDKLIEQQA